VSAPSTDALDQLVAAVAEEFAPRIAAELAPLVAAELPRPSASDTTEPWHLLDLPEAARRLGRSERWVRARKAEIGYVRLDGGALAFDLADVQAFARARRVGGPEYELAGGTPGRPLRAVGKGWDE
jgi:hypothetical protein